MSYKNYTSLDLFLVSDIWFKHFYFDSEYDSAGELEWNNEMTLYQRDKRKKDQSLKIRPLITMK